jgi:hypothetical protein
MGENQTSEPGEEDEGISWERGGGRGDRGRGQCSLLRARDAQRKPFIFAANGSKLVCKRKLVCSVIVTSGMAVRSRKDESSGNRALAQLCGVVMRYCTSATS